MKNKNQLVILGIIILIYVFLAILTYLVIVMDEIAPVQYNPSMTSTIPAWQLGLANAAIILVVYGLLGLIGIWFAGKLGLPGIFREAAGWKAWILWPLLLGVGAGIILCLGDWIFIHAGWSQGFPHPSFPFSLIASATTGIGEEIMFRSFVMGLWAFLLNALLKRFHCNPPGIVARDSDRIAGIQCKPPAGYDVIVWVTNSSPNTCHLPGGVVLAEQYYQPACG
jgi:membrane protease YdiL (CAAX protease family)